MPTHILDIITRRHSLLTLGGAALAATAMAQPQRAAGKKKGKDCQKKERQRCANDTEACRFTVLLNCEVQGGCSAAARCCEECTATGFAACALAQPTA